MNAVFVSQYGNSGRSDPSAIVVLLIAAVVGLGLWMYYRKEQARSDYEGALTALRLKPNDAIRYQAALQAAETLADRTRPEHTDRDTWRRSVRNEVELVRLQATKSAPVACVPSVETRLQKLSDLHSKGLITREELDERRQEILDEI